MPFSALIPRALQGCRILQRAGGLMKTYKQICQRTLVCDESSPPLCRVSAFALCSPPETNLKQSNTEPSTKCVATRTRCKNTTTALRPKAPHKKNQKKIITISPSPQSQGGHYRLPPQPPSKAPVSLPLTFPRPTRPTCPTSPTNSPHSPNPN